MLHSAAIEEPVAMFFEEDWHLADVRRDRAIERRLLHRFFTDADLMTADEVKKDQYYNDFAAQRNVPFFAAGVMHDPYGSYMAVSIQRSRAQGAFSAAEMAALDGVRPGLMQVGRLAHLAGQMRTVAQIEALDSAGLCCVLIDENGRVKGMTRAAQTLTGPGFAVRDGRLMLAGAPAEACAGSRIIPLAGQIMLVETNRLPGAARDSFGGAAIVSLKPLLTPASSDAEQLARRFGLSQGETRVAEALAAGLSIDQAAERLSLGRETVRTHAKRIYDKAGVSGQSAFIVKAGGA